LDSEGKLWYSSFASFIFLKKGEEQQNGVQMLAATFSAPAAVILTTLIGFFTPKLLKEIMRPYLHRVQSP